MSTSKVNYSSGDQKSVTGLPGPHEGAGIYEMHPLNCILHLGFSTVIYPKGLCVREKEKKGET